jgi:uncharacterized protein (TIGR02265 family)
MADLAAAPTLRVAARVVRPAVPDPAKMMTTPLDLWVTTMEPYLSPADRAVVQLRFAAWLGKPAHPTLVSLEFTDFICRAGFPDLTLGEARRRMARLSLAKYQESILGRVMLAPMRLMGFERLLQQVPKQFAAATNYGTRWVAQVGPHHWRFDAEDEIMHPEMTVGNLEAAGEMLAVPGLRIAIDKPGPRHYSFDLTWE